MKSFITGATGFVGANLVRRLLREGHEVNVLVRKNSPFWRIKELSDDVRIHEADLRNGAEIQKVIRSVRPNIIYHLATFGGFASQTDTQAIMEANFLGTVNLLRACEMVGFDYFVNTGSSSEYGIKTKPMRESEVLEPLGDYGVAKAAATLFCQAEYKTKGVPVVTLRLFSPYGPWDDPRRLIPYVIACLLRNKRPQLSSSASVRDYIYIDDVIECYLKVTKYSEFAGQVINVGSGNQISIGDVASIIEQRLGSNSMSVWGKRSLQRAEPEIWTADIEKAKTLLNWKPKIGIEEGLNSTIEWMREHLNYYLEE